MTTRAIVAALVVVAMMSGCYRGRTNVRIVAGGVTIIPGGRGRSRGALRSVCASSRGVWPGGGSGNQGTDNNLKLSDCGTAFLVGGLIVAVGGLLVASGVISRRAEVRQQQNSDWERLAPVRLERDEKNRARENRQRAWRLMDEAKTAHLCVS